LFDRIPTPDGRFFLLGAGDAREAIALRRKGFDIRGVDFAP